uniref:Uncharacterized protein n=1 Tax=Cyprinus carpio TaxID=7962 RepID=A0A8C2L4Z6_CYPCA
SGQIERTCSEHRADAMYPCIFRVCYRGFLLIFSILCEAAAFNLDLEKPTVYNGPEESYFGYSLDFYHPTQDRNT